MRAYALLPLMVLALSSCAYMTEGSLQDIEVKTPGALNSYCDMYVEGARYRVHPPEKINITRSEKDLVIDCFASGNRQRKVIVQASDSDAGPANFFAGGVGVLWDAASGALYQYPASISIDFTTMKETPNSLPQHDLKDPNESQSHDLEEFLPGVPRLNSDKYEPEPVLIPRQHATVPRPSADTAGDKKYGAPPPPYAPDTSPFPMDPSASK